VVYVVLAALSGPSATSRGANRYLHERQCSRLAEIEQAVSLLQPQDKDEAPDRRLAWEQARGSAERIREGLESTNPAEAWASGERYASQWIEIHRAEEALIQLRAKAAVVAAADMDKQRLAGSKIADANQLTTLLTGAIKDIEKDEDGARARIRMVRRAINDYRDERGAGFFRLRFRLRRWQLILGIVVYGLFALGVLAIPPSEMYVMSFAAYFLVGAAAGLLYEAWKVRANRPLVEDYGAAKERFLLVPLLSGVAACAGAFIVGILAGNSLDAVIKAAKGVDYTALLLANSPVLVVVAAAFGLAPARLIGTLQAMGERLETDLSSSEPTGEEGTGAESQG
jgi:hypothetical protein